MMQTNSKDYLPITNKTFWQSNFSRSVYDQSLNFLKTVCTDMEVCFWNVSKVFVNVLRIPMKIGLQKFLTCWSLLKPLCEVIIFLNVHWNCICNEIVWQPRPLTSRQCFLISVKPVFEVLYCFQFTEFIERFGPLWFFVLKGTSI